MKTIRSFFSIIYIVALMLSFGCTSVERTAYITTGSVIATVDAAMNGWGDAVRAGKTTPEQENRVRKLYAEYQDALQIERKLITAYKQTQDKDSLRKANTQLRSAAVALIEVVEYVIEPKTKH